MKTNIELIVFAIISQIILAKAQDPQDIADIACASSSSIYEFNSVDGYIESPGYPDVDYEDYEDCQWYLNPTGGIPDGQELFLEVVFFATESCCDEIYVYEGEGTSGVMKYQIAGSYDEGQFFSLGDVPVTLYFNTDHSVDYPGFRVYFYMGEQSPGQEIADQACTEDTRPLTLRNETNILESPGYPGQYPSSALCEWIITPDNNVNGIYLSVIYFYAYDYLYIYFAGDTNGDYETYWYGAFDAGYSIYNPGNSMALRFDASYADPGFQLVYYQADPACTGGSASILEAGDKAELKSPGYPYDIPEHLSCRWLLEAPEGQKVILTSLALDLYGDGLDCTEEYVEVLDGDTVDALSLGLFCGNSTFGTIPSTTSALQVYLRTREDSSGTDVIRTGFRFEYEAQ